MKRVLSQGIPAFCKPHPPQTGTGFKRLFYFKVKAFLGASLDNIQKFQCSDGCSDTVTEFKCPWKHRDLDPKETPEIGGIQNGNELALKSTTKYFFQVQLQMFVSKLTLCNFVVWTEKESSLFRCPTTQASCPMFVQNWRSFGLVRFSLS